MPSTHQRERDPVLRKAGLCPWRSDATNQWYSSWGKRTLDILLGLTLFVLVMPLMLVLAGIVLLSLGQPILFGQVRPGKEGKPFTLYKLRTMNDRRDRRRKLLPDAQRLNSLGRFLRSTSLDELPELWNVLRGDMSLVGPRPLLMEYLPRYSARQARRHKVKPGITGWAQVNGRNALSWDQKLKLDVWYVEHWSFWLDLRILARTVWQVAARKGISHPGSATMPEFEGHLPIEGRAPKPL